MRNHSRRPCGLQVLLPLLVTPLLAGCGTEQVPDDAETQQIAREAFQYGWPMIETFKVMYAYSIDESNAEYKAPFNRISNTARVFTPEDRAVVTPNSDTPYSMLWLDLRAEPVVLTVPEIEEGRYYSIQLIDLYTHNFDYIGTRVTGNAAGSFMIAGSRWQGDPPEGIESVIRSETEFALAIYRTQLFSPEDLPDVVAIQSGYQVQTLSAFLGGEPPPPAQEVAWPALSADMGESVSFFEYLDFLLQFAPTHPSEAALRERFARIGVGTGDFDASSLAPEVRSALQAGIDQVWNEDWPELQARVDSGELTSGDLFGTRDFLGDEYMRRFAGARIGLYGNSREEAMYPIITTDAEGGLLDASQHRYVMRWEAGHEPPADAFFSVTMYDGVSQLLVDNPLDRYLINSPMVPDLQRGDDGSITVYIQHESPGAELESNWLPAPDGPFYMVLRLYMPRLEALDAGWKPPPVVAVS
jgi:hypothetical protein